MNSLALFHSNEKTVNETDNFACIAKVFQWFFFLSRSFECDVEVAQDIRYATYRLHDRKRYSNTVQGVSSFTQSSWREVSLFVSLSFIPFHWASLNRKDAQIMGRSMDGESSLGQTLCPWKTSHRYVNCNNAQPLHCENLGPSPTVTVKRKKSERKKKKERETTTKQQTTYLSQVSEGSSKQANVGRGRGSPTAQEAKERTNLSANLRKKFRTGFSFQHTGSSKKCSLRPRRKIQS